MDAGLHNQMMIEEQYYKEHPQSPLKTNQMEKLIKIQSELKAPKNQFNKFGKYAYRNCEDILEALKPLLLKHKCTLSLSDKVCYIGDMMFTEASAIFNDGTNQVVVTAQAGIDVNRKGFDISQSFGSSSSYARKYALNGLFLIDDNKDADSQPPKEDKPVAKLPDLKKDTDTFKKVKKALADGYSMADVKSKYTVSKAVETLLTK